MMRVTKILGSVVAVGVAFVALTATTESRAGDESLVNVSCSGGALTATAASPWHINAAAPWKWPNHTKVSLDEHAAKFSGAKCDGELSAYVCNGDQCKGPIKINVK